jgi:hypothetical protein
VTTTAERNLTDEPDEQFVRRFHRARVLDREQDDQPAG